MIRWSEPPTPRLKLDVGGRVFAVGKIPPKNHVMRVVCGWCRRVLKNGHQPASTGICEACLEDLLAE